MIVGQYPQFEVGADLEERILLVSRLGRGLLELLAAIILSGILLSCTPPTPNITLSVPDRSVKPEDQTATLVVIQPGTHFRRVNLLDGNGNLMGQLDGRGYTVFQLAPGPFRLYSIPSAIAENGDRIEGDVLAGKIYFATISARWGGQKMNALNPRSPDQRWPRLKEWLEQRPRVRMDPAQVDALGRAIGDPEPLMETIDRFVEGLDRAHREVRTVRAADGI